MAKEKFIRGKHDKGKHDGRRANNLREQAAETQLKQYEYYLNILRNPQLYSPELLEEAREMLEVLKQ